MNLVGRKTPEVGHAATFDCSIWSWRVIHGLVDLANEASQLGIDTSKWHVNDGYGLETPDECNRLAGALEAMLPDLGDVITMAQAPDRTRAERVMLATLGGSDPAPIDYQVQKRLVVEFVEFLRESGGFRIY